MSGKTVWNSFDFTQLLALVTGLIPVLICITLHELSHGLVAYWLGDTTARDRGRLSLNPLKHIDVLGFLSMLVFHFGWAKPVPVNMYRFRNPKRGMALTALAGPVSNFLIAAVFMLLYGVLYIPLMGSRVGGFVLSVLALTAYDSTALGLFNLIPVPPLDGSKVLAAVLPQESYAKLMRYERWGGIVLVALVASGLLGSPLNTAVSFLMDRLAVLGQWACNGVFYLFYQ